MGIVGQRVHGHRLLTLDEHLVGVDRVNVARGGVVVPADANVDVRRHVHHVSHPRHQTGKTLGTRDRELRIHRLYCMDIVVTRSGMLRITRYDSLQLPHDLLGTGIRFSVRHPVIPGSQIHH